MSETVVKQLHFSPVANTSPHQQAFGLQQVQQRLDARPDWAASSGAAPPGGNGSGSKGFIFKLPSDDESDDIMDDDVTHITQLSPGTSDPLAQYQQQHQQGQQQWWQQQSLGQQQQQQQQHMFVFAAAPSSQQGPVESMLQAHTRKLHVYALREADCKQQQLYSQLHQVEQQLEQQLQEVQQQVAHKRARAAAADEERAQKRSHERDRKLQEVQQQQVALQAAHASALQEAHKQQAEAEAKRKAEAAAAAERQRQQQQEEQRRKQEAAAVAAKAAAEAQAKAAAQQSQQQPSAATAAAAAGTSSRTQAAPAAAQPPAAAAAAAPGSQQGSASRVSAGALEQEGQLKAKLEAAEASAEILINNPALKAARRSVEKQITMWVSQISGTQQQVREKSMQIIQLIQGCQTPEEQSLAYVTLCKRMLSQCEVQVARISSFAFPLAYVCVAVGAAAPQFMELLLAKLQQACPLLVPKHVKRTSGASDVEYFQGLGYKIIDDPKKPDVKRLENADEYVARMTAMVLLYASIVQTESAANPLPLSDGWIWMARCLNSMPPNRSCAAALMAFLSHAGFRMAAVYGRQFHKLLHNMDTHYVPALEAKAETDINLRAVTTRLRAYVSGRAFLKEPEGRKLKRVDESETVHA